MESGKYGRWAAKCGVYSELALSTKLTVSKAHQTYSEHNNNDNDNCVSSVKCQITTQYSD